MWHVAAVDSSVHIQTSSMKFFRGVLMQCWLKWNVCWKILSTTVDSVQRPRCVKRIVLFDECWNCVVYLISGCYEHVDCVTLFEMSPIHISDWNISRHKLLITMAEVRYQNRCISRRIQGMSDYAQYCPWMDVTDNKSRLDIRILLA